MASENNTVGHWLEFAKTTPPWHQNKEAEIAKCEQLRNTLCNVLTHNSAPNARRLYAEITQHKKHEDEGTVQVLIP